MSRNAILDSALLESLPDLPAKARAVASSVLPGLHASVHRGPACELVDRRPYEPGDDPRRVDWLVYARTRQLLVKRSRRDADLPVHVVLDASASMGFRGPRAPRSKLEHARILAAALAHLFLRSGDRVGVLGFGRGSPRALAPSAGGSRQLARVAGALERTEPGGDGDAASALRALRKVARRRGVVALVSDLLPRRGTSLAPLARELRALALHGHDVLVLQVRDPDEADLSFSGERRFRDPESREQLLADAGSVRAAYAREALAFEHAARDAARAGRVDLALAATDRSPREPLLTLLLRRERTAPARRRAA